MQKPDKKLFTAELQRLKAKSQAAPNGADGGMRPGRGVAPSAVDLSEVLEAIGALRGDVRALKHTIDPDAVDDDGEQEELVPADMLNTKRAEVNLLKTELRGLAMCIDQTKHEIAALRPQDVEEDRIMAVTFELDAIVSSTEGATQTILEAAERIDAVAGEMHAHLKDSYVGRMAEDINEQVVSIFEACNFQDITGQRITKVVNTLKYIEDRVNRMVSIWGAESFSDLESKKETHVADDDNKLLNGPQLESKAISQDEIDALFG